MSNHYIGTVYLNPSIVIREENNYKSVIAVNDIAFGELLIIEHALSSTADICQTIIEHNEYLFDEYYPRKEKWIDNNERQPNSREKINHNSFAHDKGDNLIMGDMIVKINHSCDQNCAVFFREDYNISGTSILFIELYSIRKIKRDTELTISYGPKTSHERDFVCNCGKTLEERIKEFDLKYKLVSHLGNNCKEIVKEKIYNYLLTPIAKKILLYHYLANNGIFINNDIISAYDEKGGKLIDMTVSKFIGFDNTKDLGNNIKIDLTNKKFTIFLSIIKKNLFDELMY